MPTYRPFLRQPALLAGAFLALASVAGANTRFHQYTRQFHEPENAAVPLASGYLGGEGDEYLSGGAFLPDGSLLLAGTAYGPVLTIAGRAPRVIGRDAPTPDFTMPMRGDRIAPPNWGHTQGAGFIVRLSPAYDRIVEAVRFPWGAGSLTDIATGPDGGIYVAGIQGDRFGDLTPAREAGAEGVTGPDRIFVGKLRPDLRGFEWCLTLRDDAGAAPKLRTLTDGNIGLVGAHAYHITPRGQIARATEIGLTGSWVQGIDFETHAEARGGDGNTRTGWEPWRQPSFQMFNADREHTFSFYRWSSRLVGTNWSRLVSDSSTRVVTFDRNGNVIMGGWSDGGNSVMAHVPYDLTRNVRGAIEERTGRRTGLPFSTWGAGVGSFAHINKIDVETGEPLAYTLFIAYLGDRNRPSSVSLDMLDTAVDNSLLLSGSSAYGLIETGSTKVNTLDAEAGDYIGGRFIAVLDEPWGNIRFSSALPGGGQVNLKRHSRNRSAAIGTDSARIGDKTRVVFVGGAVEHEKFRRVGGPQAGFGGGHLDGQFVVLEMDTLAPLPPFEPQVPTSAGRSVSLPDTDRDIDGLFVVSEGMNRHHSVLVLRDTTARKWPAIYLGRPDGQGQVDTRGRGAFTLVGAPEQVELREGAHQHRRLGGTYGSGDYPGLEIAVTVTGPETATGTIAYNGRTLELEGRLSIRDSRPSGRGVNLRGLFRATKAQLGLDGRDPDDAEDEILIEFWAPGRPAPDTMRREAAAEPAAPEVPEDPVAVAPPADARALREWTDQQGRTIRARLLARQDDLIRIEREDGETFVIRIDLLSEPDRAFVAEATGS